MRSLWSDRDARAIVAHCGKFAVPEELALRVYTARLLGGDKRLVLHGGGNVSLKTVLPDLLGDPVEVLFVKSSGCDMATLEPAGLPAVRLAPLRRLRGRAALSDGDMVRHLRTNLLDPGAPNPSVETLLHTFLPHKFIDHTHATAVLGLTNQPDGVERCADLYGRRLGIVPYVMPGFGLAKRAAEIFEQDRKVEGLILAKHGVFTFGDTAGEAYDRMIAAVSLAEDRIARGRTRVFVPAALPPAIAPLPEVAPILRGACAIPSENPPGAYNRFLLDFRDRPAVRAFVDGAELDRYGRAGVATPDHAIRTKRVPLIVPPPEAGKLAAFSDVARAAVQGFVTEYRAYAERHGPAMAIDPYPRVVLVPGLGLFGLGHTVKDARIAADIAEAWIATVTGAEAVGHFESVDEAETFAIECWAPEQAKLGPAVDKPLVGQVVVVTGGAGTIGLATGRAMQQAGAAIALLDRAGSAVEERAAEHNAFGVVCDVTRPDSVGDAFDRVVERFGGIDVVVSNAGAAWQGRIGEVDEKILRDSFELNFWAHQWVAQNAVRIMQAQGTGGVLLFNVSKQAVNPGPDFGPYGLPKAATLALMRQYALEYAAAGIRSNAVNADGIRGGLLTAEMVARRAAAYGMTAQQYMSRNLLMQEVTADDVAQAFLHLALARSTTGAFFPVDGGNIAAAPR